MAISNLTSKNNVTPFDRPKMKRSSAANDNISRNGGGVMEFGNEIVSFLSVIKQHYSDLVTVSAQNVSDIKNAITKLTSLEKDTRFKYVYLRKEIEASRNDFLTALKSLSLGGDSSNLIFLGGESGGVDSLSKLKDVNLKSPKAEQVLKYDGSVWVNAAASDSNSLLNSLLQLLGGAGVFQALASLKNLISKFSGIRPPVKPSVPEIKPDPKAKTKLPPPVEPEPKVRPTAEPDPKVKADIEENKKKIAQNEERVKKTENPVKENAKNLSETEKKVERNTKAANDNAKSIKSNTESIKKVDAKVKTTPTSKPTATATAKPEVKPPPKAPGTPVRVELPPAVNAQNLEKTIAAQTGKKVASVTLPAVTKTTGIKVAGSPLAERVSAAAAAAKPAAGSPVRLSKEAIQKIVANSDKYVKFAGKAFSKSLPWVGLLFGLYDSYQRIKKGDFIGAGIAGTSGLISMVPGAGVAAAIGLDLVNLIRDLYGDVYGIDETTGKRADPITDPKRMQRLPELKDIVWNMISEKLFGKPLSAEEYEKAAKGLRPELIAYAKAAQSGKMTKPQRRRLVNSIIAKARGLGLSDRQIANELQDARQNAMYGEKEYYGPQQHGYEVRRTSEKGIHTSSYTNSAQADPRTRQRNSGSSFLSRLNPFNWGKNKDVTNQYSNPVVGKGGPDADISSGSNTGAAVNNLSKETSQTFPTMMPPIVQDMSGSVSDIGGGGDGERENYPQACDAPNSAGADVKAFIAAMLNIKDQSHSAVT